MHVKFSAELLPLSAAVFCFKFQTQQKQKLQLNKLRYGSVRNTFTYIFILMANQHNTRKIRL